MRIFWGSGPPLTARSSLPATTQRYFRSFDGWWYIQLRDKAGKRHQLELVKCEHNRAAAIEKWHELMAARRPVQDPIVVRSNSVKTLLDTFLTHVRENLAVVTAEWYENFIDETQRSNKGSGRASPGARAQVMVQCFVPLRAEQAGAGHRHT